MSKAVICPVCGGSGKVPKSNPCGYTPATTASGTPMNTCHGCGGKGYVVVPDG